MATAAAGTSGNDVAVWEWLHETGTWMRYTAPVSNVIEERYMRHLQYPGNPANATFCLREADAHLHVYTVDLALLVQHRTDTGTERPIRRTLMDHVVTRGVTWEWSGDNTGDWHQYDSAVSDTLEEAHTKRRQSVDVIILGAMYVIDINSMEQRNKHSGFIRKVRRLDSGVGYQSRLFNGSLHSVGASTLTSRLTSFAMTPTIPPLPTHTLPAMPYRSSLGHHTFPSAPASTLTNTWNPYTPLPALSYHGGSFPTGMATSVATTSSASGRQTIKSNGAIKKSASFSDTPRKRMKNDHLPCTGNYVLREAPRDEDDYTFHKYLAAVNSPPDDEDCAICCESLSEGSGYDDSDPVVLKLERCKHMYHRACVNKYYDTGMKTGCLECPKCKAIYGTKRGNCPAGRMDYSLMPRSLSGHPGVGMIQITYSIQAGIQGPSHPSPGQPYRVPGFPRTAYLPACQTGKKVLRLLIEAWNRRLTFTVGTSSTTGESNVVIWNEIHHKTKIDNADGHGYPDPKYLDNVLQELKSQGVVDEEDPDDDVLIQGTP